ncbi:hypothetical protein M3Y99_00955200 [Aphelenchoides fujianensis]|nr:hypothetical protein M3Y99_00955200 [Aphelenchoides fujianensis]
MADDNEDFDGGEMDNDYADEEPMEDVDLEQPADDEDGERVDLVEPSQRTAAAPSERVTTQYMTKYERARILGTRALQIAMGAPVMVELEGETDPLEVARKELKERKIPIIIRRYLPDGSFEDWGVEELIVLERKLKRRCNAYQLPEEALDGLGESSSKFEQLRHRKMPAEPGSARRPRAHKMRDFKWKPIAFANREEATAYALGSLPMHYAEARFVLDELDRFDFKPQSVLDYGSGVGGVFWAAREKWNDHLLEYTFVDPNEHAQQFCMDVMRDSNGQIATPYANFRRSLTGASGHKFDVVVAQRVLSEIGSRTSQLDLARLLWQRTRKYLVLIESNLRDHFASLMQVRDFLLLMGSRFNPTEMERVLRDKHASEVEKYALLKSMGDGVEIPTVVERGHVVAPCPHDSGCPLFVEREYKSSCLHSLKYKEVRTDGRSKSQTSSGLVKSSFSYVVLAKGERPSGTPRARILTANEVVRFYEAARKADQGHLFPLQEKVVSSDSELHDIRRIIDEVEGEFVGKE